MNVARALFRTMGGLFRKPAAEEPWYEALACRDSQWRTPLEAMLLAEDDAIAALSSTPPRVLSRPPADRLL